MNNPYGNPRPLLDVRAVSVWNAENARARREYIYGSDLLNSNCPTCTLEATCWRCRSKARGYLKVATSQAECAELLAIIDRPSPFAAKPKVPKPRKRPPCGTPNGYASHRRHGEVTCRACRVAHNVHREQQRKGKKR